jgi:sterol desaturase/sphingolipid hydroxylase (fatty acid hydroxylase superfamily)
MAFFGLEHTKTFYYADFVAYIFLIILVSGLLIGYTPGGARLSSVMSVVGGLALWPLIEYVLHRYVMHGLEPFRGWHMEHHKRPRAFIGTPTIFSAGLIFILVFLPTSVSANVWVGTGLTLGVTIGYLAFSWTHHAVHYWRPHTRWLRNRNRLHNIHHRPGSACNYGVTTSFFDTVFGTRVG